MRKVCDGGAPYYVCHADGKTILFRQALLDSGFEVKQTVIWAKQSFVLGRQDYQWQHEPILYGWAAGASHKWYGGRAETTVWEIDRPMLHLCLWGNHYSEIERNKKGEAVALWPITPWRVSLRRVDKALVYTVATDNGVVTLPFANVLHIKGLSYDGLSGLPPMRAAKEAIGLSLAAQKYAAKFFANDARPGGILEHPGQLSDEASERLRKSFERTHEGLDNKFRVAVLEEGMTGLQS